MEDYGLRIVTDKREVFVFQGKEKMKIKGKVKAPRMQPMISKLIFPAPETRSFCISCHLLLQNIL
jgi:hypothetical protein